MENLVRPQMFLRLHRNNEVLIGALLFHLFNYVFCQCGGSSLSLTADQSIQYFTSSGYNNGAGTYSSNLNCTWVINSGQAGYKVVLYLPAYDITCSGDVINLYDGDSIAATSLLSGVCGTSASTSVTTSTSQYMTLSFTTDGATQAAGFKAAYFAVTDLSGTGCTAEQTLTPTATGQYLTSPSFPSLYDVNSNCRWVITAPTGTVRLEIVYSDIETSANCAFDSLEIYDGDYVCENTKIASICARFPNGVTGTYLSNGTSFLLKFTSDGSLSFTGFFVKYTQVEDVVTTSAVATSDDRLMLGIGIGCACGATGAFLIVFIITVFKSKCRSPKIVSPRVKTVEPMNGHVAGMRTPSIIGSTESPDSMTHSRNGFIIRPNSNSRRSSASVDIKSNGFVH